MKYMVVIERGATSYGAYVPDLPGCVAVADSRDEVVEMIREAIELHLEAMRAHGETPPEPHSTAELIDIAA